MILVSMDDAPLSIKKQTFQFAAKVNIIYNNIIGYPHNDWRKVQDTLNTY